MTRVSIRPNDPGYQTHLATRHQGYRAAVTFNGSPVTGVITADSDNGMIVRIKDPVEWDHERSAPVDEVLHGKVEIEFNAEVCL